MNIVIFNRTYIVRRFEPQRNVGGYLVSDYSDMKVSIHVHPASSQTVMALPEGERKMNRLQGHGTVELVVADQELNQKGDLLWYDGHWYECRGCTKYDHTLLSHYNYDFSQVAVDSAQGIDFKAPEVAG